MWLTEGCGGRRRAVATPNRESRKEKKRNIFIIIRLNFRLTLRFRFRLGFIIRKLYRRHSIIEWHSTQREVRYFLKARLIYGLWVLGDYRVFEP